MDTVSKPSGVIRRPERPAYKVYSRLPLRRKEASALACDASQYGVVAVLLQTYDQGRKAPITFASRTLSQTQRNYAQLDKEGLATVCATTHFRQYIAGRKVTL